MHRLVVWQRPGLRGARSRGVGGLGVRDDVVDIVRDAIARHSEYLDAFGSFLSAWDLKKMKKLELRMRRLNLGNP